ncbi:hypothetical protein BC939DRAFT_470065 [Gamsiella multidivaricata]|uniref:uncharacterized protein n=1 Tax=Gamsiella multidivaricata TaxID=101098 RepID=UPI00222017AF|nr:uncharacterized protein BC939DRAFT_470065 [Gamsiella multidivaricata]KAG0369522.1 hypothetical protein BGZ54_009665 [Gamsiella multidivaricata]KAI7816191.1 hypothetical protein BC939DRAFT_470065 [Gamsiella multidivaricata]
MAQLLQFSQEIMAENDMPNSLPTETEGGIKPFLNLTREQCHILLALYHVVDPGLEPKVPVLFPEMARKLREDHAERNSILAKLERADEVYQKEFLNLREIQKAVAEALLKSDMDQEKARNYLKMKPKDTPMEKLKIQEILTNGFLLGGVRDQSAGNDSDDKQAKDAKKKASPLSAPGFREAKAYYDYAFEKFKFSMAAVQLGNFYAVEHEACAGEHCIEGEDPEKVSIEYYLKAAELGNPMAMHKAGWHYDRRGDWNEAIAWYVKAADEGFPDAAHNLGMIYHEGNPKSTPPLPLDLPKAIHWYNKALQIKYGPSGTQLGRIFFKLATDKSFREKLPSSDQNYSPDPKEYFQTAISYFDQANHMLEVESMQFLGMIYGSKDFGLYDLDRAQNLFELALMVSNGGQQSFEYLSRTLNARRAIIMDHQASQDGGENKVDQAGLKTCAANGCEKKESQANEFQRCAGCKKRYYCSRLCQVTHWKEGHKKACKK